MKKIFLFAAAVVAAMTINAKVVDLTTAGLTIDDWTVSEATLNETESNPDAGKYVYDIQADVASTSYVKAFADVMFQIKNSSAKAKVLRVRWQERYSDHREHESW